MVVVVKIPENVLCMTVDCRWSKRIGGPAVCDINTADGELQLHFDSPESMEAWACMIQTDACRLRKEWHDLLDATPSGT